MATHLYLIAHPDNPAGFRQRVDATVTQLPAGGLAVTYAVRGAIDDLRLPTVDAPAPADTPWSTSCCELFVATAGTAAYREFNFSPSGQWAVYHFGGYRERAGEQLACPVPTIAVRLEDNALNLDVELPAAALPVADAWRLGLSAVLETRDGRLGYWALNHAPGRPDFHHPSAFALTIAKDNNA
ncbi:MAG: DOMON-like domain-containing protein [Sulfurisoma sp.]|nr:DOMON-like domain-containing protein [Sulfurisoma sp.]